jgi:hypothetical protein
VYFLYPSYYYTHIRDTGRMKDSQDTFLLLCDRSLLNSPQNPIILLSRQSVSNRAAPSPPSPSSSSSSSNSPINVGVHGCEFFHALKLSLMYIASEVTITVVIVVLLLCCQEKVSANSFALLYTTEPCLVHCDGGLFVLAG